MFKFKKIQHYEIRKATI